MFATGKKSHPPPVLPNKNREGGVFLGLPDIELLVYFHIFKESRVGYHDSGRSTLGTVNFILHRMVPNPHWGQFELSWLFANLVKWHSLKLNETFLPTSDLPRQCILY